MMDASKALWAIPAALRKPLLEEYRKLIQNYMERRWSPAEMSGGLFCEIVYSILDGHAKSKYPAAPSKPRDLVAACRALESNSHVPRSFQILIPRMLPALYEVRNNRGVGHSGGDVDPNHMDATVVVSMCNWILSELVRTFHGLSVDDAQVLVDNLSEMRIPLVWKGTDVKRVLDPKITLRDQILLLVASSPSAVPTDELIEWLGNGNRPYMNKLLSQLHSNRMVELSKDKSTVEVLPPGSAYVHELVAKRMKSGNLEMS